MSSVPRLLQEGAERQRLGRHAEALAALERCLEASPAHAEAHLLAGYSNFELGRWQKAVAHTRVALAAMPGNAAAWSNLAAGLRALGQSGPAREAARRAVDLDPRLAQAWNALGLVEQDVGRVASARTHFARALGIDPRYAHARMNLANCDQAEGRLAAALDGYRDAAALNPALADIPYNAGHLHHKATGDLDQAIVRYREAIALRPDYALAHHNLAHVLFLTGQFAEAWREYRWRPPRLEHEERLRASGRAYDPAAPDSLAGARIRIVGEQGLGDVLFLLRFAPLLRARGATLDFAGDPRLHGMLRRTGLFEHFGVRDELVPDTEVLAGDLPLLFAAAELEAAPPALALTPDPQRVESVRARVASLGNRPHIAIAWRSGIAKSGLEERLFKEVPLEALGAALRNLPATWVSVQREPRDGETERLAAKIGAPVHDLSSLNEDLEDALAFMSLVEYSVGVSSTNVHLRAGTGGAAHVLVPFPPEWRWMASGTSRWFPQMQVYRQQSSGDWSAALGRLEMDLSAALRPDG